MLTYEEIKNLPPGSWYVSSTSHVDTPNSFSIKEKGKWADTNDITIALLLPGKTDPGSNAQRIIDAIKFYGSS